MAKKTVEQIEVIAEVVEFKNPFTPNLTYVDWMDKNKLKDLPTATKFVESLDCITDEQKEHIKKELKLIIK